MTRLSSREREPQLRTATGGAARAADRAKIPRRWRGAPLSGLTLARQGSMPPAPSTKVDAGRRTWSCESSSAPRRWSFEPSVPVVCIAFRGVALVTGAIRSLPLVPPAPLARPVPVAPAFPPAPGPATPRWTRLRCPALAPAEPPEPRRRRPSTRPTRTHDDVAPATRSADPQHIVEGSGTHQLLRPIRSCTLIA